MIDIRNLTHEELVSFIHGELKEPVFRADQVWRWLWKKGARSFDEMTNVSKATRALLRERCAIIRPVIVGERKSPDGTVKFLLRLTDGETVETVLIPSESRDGVLRMTQCVSCQVGCAMACTFCATGGMGFVRNMTMGEILGQVLIAREYLGSRPENNDPRPAENRAFRRSGLPGDATPGGTEEEPRLRNVVFMGMGEPLLNFKNVTASLKVLNDEAAFNFSPRRITVSTCGLQKGLLELGESNLAYLAVSLHAPTQELRAKIMPKAAQWHLDDLVATLAKYPLKARERLTFEYLLLGGVNDAPEHARRLGRIMARVKGKINLIVYNPVPGAPYAAPKPEDVRTFMEILHAKGITAIIRKSKGQDIAAACGQLKAETASR